MNNKILPVIVLIGFAVSAFLANKLYAWKTEQLPYQAKVPTQFYAGMDKFLSNVSWMTLVQWEAQASENSFTPEEADKLVKRLNALTNLDPLFIDAYVDGALTVAPIKPADALALLDKAIAMNAGWKAPLHAGHVCLNYTRDYPAAERYLAMAASDPAAPFYVRTALGSARCEAVQHDPVKSIDIWYKAYLESAPADKDFRHAAAVRIMQYNEELSAGPESGVEATPPPKASAEDRARVTRIVDEIRPSLKVAEPPTTAPTTMPNI